MTIEAMLLKFTIYFDSCLFIFSSIFFNLKNIAWVLEIISDIPISKTDNTTLDNIMPNAIPADSPKRVIPISSPTTKIKPATILIIVVIPISILPSYLFLFVSVFLSELFLYCSFQLSYSII